MARVVGLGGGYSWWGVGKVEPGPELFFFDSVNFLHMLTMSSKLFQPRLSFLHMLIMSSRIDII